MLGVETRDELAKTVQSRFGFQRESEMPKLTQKLPSYRLHKRSGNAVVNLSGVDHYLGKHGSSESKVAYDQLISKWFANGRRQGEAEPEPVPEITVAGICAATQTHSKPNRKVA